MARRWLAVLAAPGLIWAATPAWASDLEFYTGQTLTAECGVTADAPDYAVHHARCAAYVVGVSDAQQAAQGASRRERVCLPTSADSDRLAATVAAFLTAHPEKQRLAAQDVVTEALAGRYPCK
ncbi:MAG TPA: Rap1a/Tai family immunity protein [Caulobacteraceae bacterium]|jgi:hypothetical protein